MAYMHIENLYKDQRILNHKECYTMEKIHGTSAHITWFRKSQEIYFFPGGGNPNTFEALFNVNNLEKTFLEKDLIGDTTIYGEFYGGKIQRMSHIYGPEQRFVAFEVKIGGTWLTVPEADEFCSDFSIEFVDWLKTPTNLKILDALRDLPSIQAARNGMGSDKPREGVVLRPLQEEEYRGKRVIAKHKSDLFRETKSPRPVVNPEKLALLENARAIADEWVTQNRLEHVLDRGKAIDPDFVKLENIRKVIEIMTEDVLREGAGELVDSPETRKEIGRVTALMFKKLLQK